MNQFISFVCTACAILASVHCSSYGYGYGSSADVLSNALGSLDNAAAPAYLPPTSKYSIQPLSSYELYPGRNSYKSYHYAPTYRQIALPIAPSVPLAKLYIFGHQLYDGPAVNAVGAY